MHKNKGNILISKNAKIGKNVTIDPFTIIHDDVAIGDNTIIESYCILGVRKLFNSHKTKLVIGSGSHIRSGTTIYSNSTFGPGLTTGHNAIIREEIQAGKKILIGSSCELEGNTIIGDYTKIHSKSFIPRNTKVGSFVWLFPNFQGSTDPLPPSNIEKPIIINDMAVVGVNSLITAGVTIGTGSFVGASSVVVKNVPDTYCVKGNPAKFFTTINRLINFEHKIRHPWPLHNREYYPDESYQLMDEILDKINRIISEKSK